MTQRQAVVAWGVFLVALVAFLVGPMLPIAQLLGQVKQGPPPEKLLPAGALLYVGWDGADAHRDAWRKTAAYEAIIESGLGDVVTKFLRAIERDVGREPVRMAIDSLAHLTAKGLHLAIAAPSVEEGPPLPQLTIVVPGAGAAAREIGVLANQIGIQDLQDQKVESRQVTRTRIPNLPAAEIGWWAEGPDLVIAAGVGAVDAALQVAQGKSPDISTNPVWKRFRQQTDFEVTLVSWIDLATIRQMAGAVPVPGPAGGPPARVDEILESIGLGKVGPLGTQWGFKDRALRSETILEAPAPRTGMLAFADQKPIRFDELPPLPAGADGFYAARFDWSRAASGLLKISSAMVRQFAPPGTPTGEQFLAQIRQYLGVDLQADFFDPLGDVMVLYGDTRQGMLGMGVGLAISVDDSAKLQATVDKLLARLKEEAGRAIGVQTIRRGARTIQLLEFRQAPIISPALTVDDKWLVIGLYPQTIDSFLLRRDGKLPRWKPSDVLTQALADLPKEYTSVTYSDPRDGLRAALGIAPTLAMFAQMSLTEQRRRQMPPGAAEVEPLVSAADFPPAEWITQPLFENLSVCSVNDREIRWSSRSSLPAVPLLGGAGLGSGGSAAPVLVALLLPAVQQAREAARRTQSKNNLKQMGLALHNFHDVNNAFPAGTHQNDKLKADKRLSWMADILPYIDQSALYNRIDFRKAWDDEANAQAVQGPLAVFLNPGDTSPAGSKYGVTHYVGIAGLGKDAPMLPRTDKRAGVFGYNRITRITDISDGTSNTMGVSEASKDFGPWSAGGPSTIRGLTQKPYINGPDGLGGPYRGGMNVLMMDGSVRFVSENIDPTTFEALSTIAGGEAIGNF